MKSKELQDLLDNLGACREARKWAEGKSLEEAWGGCDRGDWLLWLAVRLFVDRRLIVQSACACARTALKLIPAGEDRPRIAIETAEAWARGEATMEQVRAAANAAANAANAANAAAAANAYAAAAAYAAYYADDAAAAAAYAAANAAYDTTAAAAAAAAYAAANAADANRQEAHKETADIVRSMIPFDVVATAAERRVGDEELEDSQAT